VERDADARRYLVSGGRHVRDEDLQRGGFRDDADHDQKGDGGGSRRDLDRMGGYDGRRTGDLQRARDFNTSYWVFDGASHGSTLWSTTSSDYGFFFNGLNGAVEVFNLSTAMSDVTITNVAGVAIATDVEKFFVQTDNSTKAVSNITISRCLIDGWQNAYYATSRGADDGQLGLRVQRVRERLWQRHESRGVVQ
jgi:hypothetical protein